MNRTIESFKLWAALMIGCLVLSACTSDDGPVGPTPEDEVEEMLRNMTLREKVGQIFFIRPESLDPNIHWVNPTELAPLKLQAVNDDMRNRNKNYPVGGIILYAWNIEDEAQLAQFLPQLKALQGMPLMCIDEEDVERDAPLRDGDVPCGYQLGLPDGDDSTYRCTEGDWLGHSLHDVVRYPAGQVA